MKARYSLLTVAVLLFWVRFQSYAQAGSWSRTGSLTVGRGYHTATLLLDGRVLVAGGLSCADDSAPPVAAAEIYDPYTGTWTPTGSMTRPRFGHTANLLLDGRVLVTGDYSDHNGLAGAEIYDPNIGTWAPTTSPSVSGTATLLLDGRVLVASTGGAQIYEPDTATWSPTGRPSVWGPATLLLDGRVLVAGGTGAEIYNLDTGDWSPTGIMLTGRGNHGVTRLTDGRVLVAGGWSPSSGYLATAELYAPNTGKWSSVESMSTRRVDPTATSLVDSRALVVGGAPAISSCYGPIASAETYDPASGTWQRTGPVTAAHAYHTATLLIDGRVLVAGSYSACCGADGCFFNCSPDAELYTPE